MRFTCDGKDVSPPLAWTRVPRGTKELALQVEDESAHRFLHWSLLRIPARSKKLSEGRRPPASVETLNSFGNRHWSGPCPPKGDRPHRYAFALYALREQVGVGPDASADEVRAAIARLATARGTLTATYRR